MPEKVVAVIPAFNGTVELVDCVRAVLLQSRPVDSVYVIDNNGPSSDVPEAFEAQGWTVGSPDGEPRSAPLLHVPLPANTGSMGGFSEGIRRAYEAGADWIWLVDQDAAPTPTCLERLLSHQAQSSVLGPVAVPEPGASELSFPVWDAVHQTLVYTMEDLRRLSSDGVIDGDVCPMNGSLLVNRRVVEAIGNIRPEMFHWGGDIEYCIKAARQGFKPLTAVDAINLHPLYRTDYGRVLDRTIEVPHGALTRYCLYRNNSFIYSRYYGAAPFLKRFLEYAWYYLVTSRADVPGFLFYLRATFDGLIPVWGREKGYLNDR